MPTRLLLLLGSLILLHVMCFLLCEGHTGQRIMTGVSVMKCCSTVLYKDDRGLHHVVI